jgi:hypothetical protein
LQVNLHQSEFQLEYTPYIALFANSLGTYCFRKNSRLPTPDSELFPVSLLPRNKTLRDNFIMFENIIPKQLNADAQESASADNTEATTATTTAPVAASATGGGKRQ